MCSDGPSGSFRRGSGRVERLTNTQSCSGCYAPNTEPIGSKAHARTKTIEYVRDSNPLLGLQHSYGVRGLSTTRRPRTMNTEVTAGSRLDSLPIGRFHRRLVLLVGLGMFCDSFDNTLSSAVLASLLPTGFSTLELNSLFLSLTFAGLA